MLGVAVTNKVIQQQKVFRYERLFWLFFLFISRHLEKSWYTMNVQKVFTLDTHLASERKN